MINIKNTHIEHLDRNWCPRQFTSRLHSTVVMLAGFVTGQQTRHSNKRQKNVIRGGVRSTTARAEWSYVHSRDVVGDGRTEQTVSLPVPVCRTTLSVCKHRTTRDLTRDSRVAVTPQLRVRSSPETVRLCGQRQVNKILPKYENDFSQPQSDILIFIRRPNMEIFSR
jgi:hypothetical protein